MAGDEVRGKAATLQLFANPHHGQPVLDRDAELADEGMSAGCRSRRLVDDFADTRELPVALLGDEYHLVASGGEVPGGIYELAWKILVDKEPVHRTKRLAGSAFISWVYTPVPKAQIRRAAASPRQSPYRARAASASVR